MNLRLFLNSLLFALLLSANFASAQNNTWVTDKRNHQGFNAISVETAGDVYIYLSNHFSVEVEGNPETIAKITTEVSNKTLFVRNKQQYFTWNSKNNPLKIRIHLPLLEKLDLSGSGDVEVKGLIRNPRFDVNLSGSSDVRIEKIAVRDLQTKLSGSGDIQFGSGNADSGDLHLSGSGAITARNLQITDGRANLSGSGKIEIWAKRYLDIDLGGSGTIAYRGNPQIAKEVNGSGSVRRLQ
ncbi:MAG TPA: head GIN domain-containing protein [Rhodothermales bacterium]|nr:head GIN domain-containing protein [Rhodothermales bacterium]